MSSGGNQYWLVCVPNEAKNAQATRQKLDSKTQGMELSTNKPFKLPDQPQLKVGTIDQLMQLSDELSKIDTFVEATVKKIERTCVDIVRAENKEQRERDAANAAAGTGTAASDKDSKAGDPKAGGKATNPGAKPGDNKANAPPAADLKIERVQKDNSTAFLTPEAALEDFAWDMRRYHSSKDVGSLADLIFKASTRADDELKNKLAEFNDLKQNVNAIERKEGGSLLVRPLGPYVRKTDIFEHDYLTTLLVVVPKVKEPEFLASYEFLEAEAVAREKTRDEERKAQKQKDAENKKASDEAKAKVQAERKKQHAVAVQAKRDADGHAPAPAAAATPAAAAAAPKAESEEEAKRREDEKKREDEEAAAETKRKEEEAEKKRKEEERRYACWNVVPGSAKKLTRIRDGDAKSPKASATGSAAASPKATGSGGGTADEPDDDDEFVLYRVVVMRKGADSYRNLLRDKRYTVRPFKYDPAEDKSQKDKKKVMDQQKQNLYRSLVGWCNATFSDVYNAWLHIKAMRIFVEAVLRYGLPIDFQCVVLKPRRGLEKRLREALSDLYSKLSGDSSLADQLDAGEQDLSGMGTDFYPYVYLPVTLSEIAPEKQT